MRHEKREVLIHAVRCRNHEDRPSIAAEITTEGYLVTLAYLSISNYGRFPSILAKSSAIFVIRGEDLSWPRDFMTGEIVY